MGQSRNMQMQRKSPRLDSRRQSHCEDDGRERNGVYKSHFRFQGVFLCEFNKESRMVPRAGKTFSERKDEDQLKFILKKWGRVTKVAREAV
ncbi:hypothetical protein CK203_023853 [Vitis vinifera]|uniref:Uncharacterized protein n=1 Tax=Vitis vinifera TaxID=29760 RepID=A0A438JA24_VITVI|nr:hypothetical protein CK203_023853 [Vitis vinifera]